MKTRRSLLFIPGNNPSMIQNASLYGADSIIFDLEDAVSIKEKDSARILMRELLNSYSFDNIESIVRINSFDTPFSILDIKEIAKTKVDTLMIPKATATDLKEISSMLYDIELQENKEVGTIKLMPIIETAFSLETIEKIVKSTPRIDGLLLGAEDLTTDFGVVRTKKGLEIDYARNRLVSICKAYKIDALDTPFTDIDDYEGLIYDIEKAKSLGYTGKSSINPRQVNIIHKFLYPTNKEIDFAKRVIFARDEAEKNNLGVFTLDNKMIDAPIINRALNTIEKSKLHI
jgi:citrate lyase subunit beta / citryl-CoA lyase